MAISYTSWLSWLSSTAIPRGQGTAALRTGIRLAGRGMSAVATGDVGGAESKTLRIEAANRQSQPTELGRVYATACTRLSHNSTTS